MKPERVSKLVKRISESFEDIRAEIIVSDLLAGDVHIDDIFIRFIGQEKRPKRRDIAEVRAGIPDGRRSRLELLLNRDSIYDTLPEGLFHQPAEDGQALSVAAMVDEYNRQQKEEEEARQFFAPFENELFLQKSFNESEEFKQLFQIQHPQLSRPVLKRLGIEPGLPQHFTSKLVRMIPHATKIAGNVGKTEQVLTLLLGDQVRLHRCLKKIPDMSGHASYLGDTELGSDMVIGSAVVPDHPLTEFIIGPITKKEMLLYKEEEWKAQALQTLINFFVPVEWETAVRFEIEEKHAGHFNLNDKPADACLGYTTKLVA